MRVGFIGLGNMGAYMATCLLDAGHELFVYDLEPAAVQKLAAQGAQPLTDLDEFAQQRLEVIFTMLPAAPQVNEVYLGAQGLVTQLQGQNCILVDCSTIDPHTAQQVAQRAQQQGLEILDAPVSGGTVGAKAGTLTFMVGGSKQALQTVEPLFSIMGKNTIHCGDNGHGQVAKIANNMLLGISMIGVAEAMNLGMKLGMDPHTLAEVINHSSGRCWSSDTNNPVPDICPDAPASRDYQGGFASGLMQKDLRLALQAAQKAEQSVFMGALAEQMYQYLNQQQDPSLDFSAIIRLYEKG